MQILVKNPDGTLAKAITQEQFAIVHQYVIDQMNAGVKIRDDTIRTMLHKAGKPIDFTVDTVVVPAKPKRK